MKLSKMTITLIIVAVLALAAILYFFVFKKPSEVGSTNKPSAATPKMQYDLTELASSEKYKIYAKWANDNLSVVERAKVYAFMKNALASPNFTDTYQSIARDWMIPNELPMMALAVTLTGLPEVTTPAVKNNVNGALTNVRDYNSITAPLS